MTDDWNLPWTGRCRCERLTLRISAAPLVTFACHCSGCQRMSASAFSMSILVPSDGFEVTSGTTELGGLQGPNQHHYCTFCKTWVFTRPDRLPQFVNVRATMLDDHSWVVPFVDTCKSEGFPWATTGAKHSFPDIPPDEAFGPIMADFAQTSPRPQRR